MNRLGVEFGPDRKDLPFLLNLSRGGHRCQPGLGILGKSGEDHRDVIARMLVARA